MGASSTTDSPRPAITDNERLAEIATRVRTDAEKLGVLLRTSLNLMLQIGEALTAAKRLCNPRRGAWSKFVKTTGIGERYAREAVQFHGRRDEIEEYKRLVGDALTVTAVRKLIAIPRAEAKGKSSGRSIGGGESVREPAKARGPRGKEPRASSMDGKVGGSTRRDLARVDDPARWVNGDDDPPAPPETMLDEGQVEIPPTAASDVDPDPPLGLRELPKLFEGSSKFLDDVIPALGPDSSDACIADGRRWARTLLDSMARLDAALDALCEARG